MVKYAKFPFQTLLSMSELLWQVKAPSSDESRDGLSAWSPRLEANGQDGKTDEVDTAAHDVPENIPNLNRYLKISCTKNFQRSRIAAS